MVDESWDVFTKRMLVEKHISDIMYENPEGACPPAQLCRPHGCVYLKQRAIPLLKVFHLYLCIAVFFNMKLLKIYYFKILLLLFSYLVPVI